MMVILSMQKRNKNNRGTRFNKALNLFKNHGGLLRTAQALREGIHPATLYELRDSGMLEVVSRGVFRLAKGPLPGNPDLVTVSVRIPGGVICLISALAFHELTTQIPHEVQIALPRGTEEPRLSHPPIKTYRFTGLAFSEGIESHDLGGGVSARVYNPEKTLADCFKCRNKIGLDTAIEAIRLYRERRPIRVNELMHYAEICRVKKVVRPYIEALL
jgi:predicted transcriptional regulator of viral defense system